MRDQSLRAHVANLEQQGELIRITKEADPHENISAIGWKAYDRLGKSTLFTNLRGFPGWEVVNQVITDRKKWSIALGISEEEFIPTLVERIKRQIEPVEVGAEKAPVKEVILKGKEADLTKIPALWHAEQDPSPYIASGMAIIKDP
ncbi:MAG TPA: hypothetical protein DEV64_01320, partial [Rhodospirillaceae bacterium]|nr:hypothetical protein [Rhodospirillaceae bacterium]